jgi:hypothetical protein
MAQPRGSILRIAVKSNGSKGNPLRGVALFVGVLVIVAVALPVGHGHASPVGHSGEACICAVPCLDVFTAFPLPALNGRLSIGPSNLHDAASPNLLDPPPKSGFLP